MKRRRAGIVLGLLLALPLAASRADEPVPDLGTRKQGTDWPRFLGPTGDGKSGETGLDLVWPAEGPPVLWQREIGDGYSMPSISRGRLFLFDRHGTRERLTCLHAETGEELWRTEYEAPYEDLYGFSPGPRTSPVVDGDRVYTFGVEGRLRCQDVRDGSLRWEIATSRRYGVVPNFFGVGSTPVVEGDLLLVQVGGSPPGSPSIDSGKVTGNGSGVVAFDKRTGAERYRVSDELASYASPVVATVGKRRQAFVFARGGLIAFDPRTGALDFRFPWRARVLASVNAANPVVVGDLVLISECYGPGSALLRVSEDGAYDVTWQDAPGREKRLLSHWTTPIHHQGVVYGVSGRASGEAELRAFELVTGKRLWTEPGLERSTLLWVEGHLIVLTERGRLLVAPATRDGFAPVSDVTLRGPAKPNAAGRPLLEYPAWNAPALAHGMLYVRGKDRLVCLDLLPDPAR